MFETGLGSDAACHETTIPNSVSFGGTMTHYIIVPSMGTFSFLVSGTKPKYYLFWYSLFRSLFRREWTAVKEILTLDATEKKRRKGTPGGTPYPTTHNTPASSYRFRTIQMQTIFPAILALSPTPPKENQALKESQPTTDTAGDSVIVSLSTPSPSPKEEQTQGAV